MNAPAEYVASLSAGGKLKLRAKSLLATGDSNERFDACVLLHEAARIERRAAESLVTSAPETRLRALVEECGCLVEGYDPIGAADAWSRIVRTQIDADTASAMLSRLEPRFRKAHEEFAKSASTFKWLVGAAQLVPDSKQAQTDASIALTQATGRFPGVAGLWWATYRIADARRTSKIAWEAITRACRLEPDNKNFEAFRFFAASWTRAPREADAVLASAQSRLDSAGPRLCLMYALAELRLAERAPAAGMPASERWTHALTAARAGLAQAPEGTLWSHLRAVDLLASSLLAGNEPTVENILYRAGLSDLAVVAPRRPDLLALLSDDILQAA